MFSVSSLVEQLTEKRGSLCNLVRWLISSRDISVQATTSSWEKAGCGRFLWQMRSLSFETYHFDWCVSMEWHTARLINTAPGGYVISNEKRWWSAIICESTPYHYAQGVVTMTPSVKLWITSYTTESSHTCLTI